VGDTGDKVPWTYRLEPGPIDLRKRKMGEGIQGGKKEKGKKRTGKKKKREERRNQKTRT
jgi:hypothetical protein